MAVAPGPFNQERDTIYGGWLGDLYPDAEMQPSTDLPPDTQARLHSAGLGLAHIVLKDGTELHRTYVRDAYHPAVLALERIAAAENHGLIVAGNHDALVDRLLKGIPSPLDRFLS